MHRDDDVEISLRVVDRVYVLSKLKENVERAMQHQPVLDSKGQPTGECVYHGAVANRALELLGKEQGMFVERGEHKHEVQVVDYSVFSDEHRSAGS